MKKITLLLLFGCFALLTQAQQSHFHTYVWRIHAAEAEMLYQQGLSALQPDFFRELVGTVNSDLVLSDGHYLLVYPDFEQVRISLIQTGKPDALLLQNGRRSYLKLPASTGRFLLNGKPLRHKASLDAYRLKRNLKEEFLRMETPSDTLFYQLSVDNYWNREYRLRDKFRRKYAQQKYLHKARKARKAKLYGYLALNQPRYRPADTLHLKAYVTDWRGRPHRDSLHVFIRDRSSNKRIFSRYEKPDQLGLIQHSWALHPDSLQLNRQYVVMIQSQNEYHSSMSRSFQFEDYQLREASYELSTHSEKLAIGDSLVILAEGFDPNGHRQIDARVKLLLLPDNIRSCSSDSLLVPDTLWTHTSALRPDSVTRIVVPAELLPPCSSSWKLKAFFVSSSGEQHDKQRTFNLHYPEELEAQTQEASKYAKVIPSLQLRGDSLRIRIDNPDSTLVTWWLLTARRTLLEGHTSSARFDTLLPNVSYRDYWLKVNYLSNDQMHSNNEEAYASKKMLQVELIQPEKVFPGEEVDVELRVRDYRGRPVSNVELTANALNAQFDDNLPVSGPQITKKQTRERKQRPRYKLDREVINKRPHPLDSAWYARLQLQEQLFYQLRFAGSGALFHYDTLDIGQPEPAAPQFAPYIINQGKAEPVYLIYCNSELVYYHGVSGQQGYSFPGKEGYNRISIRTRDREITIDSVLLKTGWKLDFSLHRGRLATLPYPIQVRSMPPMLTAAEKKLLQQSMFVLRSSARQGYTYLMDPNQGRLFRAEANTTSFMAGPFKSKSSLHYQVQGEYYRRLWFEPGFNYEVEEKRERLYEHKLFPQNETVSLAASLPLQIPGQRLLNRFDIEAKLPSRRVIKTTPSYNQRLPGLGRYQFEYQPAHDSLALRYVVLYQEEFSTIYAASSNVLSVLQPGTYRVAFFIGQGLVHERLIDIQANALLYENLRDVPLERNDSLWMQHYFLTQNELRQGMRPNPYEKTGALVRGKTVDEETGEPILFANIALYVNGVLLGGTQSDFDGNFEIWVPKSGGYGLEVSYVGYQTSRVEFAGPISYAEISLQPGVVLEEVQVVGYSVPLIEVDNTTQGIQVSGDLIQVRGSRSDATDYYIDGVRVSGSVPYSMHPAAAEALEEEATGRIRNTFRDNAWWEPSIRTDRKGRAYIRVQYPDDITAWDTYAVGMDKRRRGGIGRSRVQAYQPLTAQLATPRFLIEGDEASVSGRIANFQADSVQLSTRLLLNEQPIHQRNWGVREGGSEQIPFQAPMGTDSVQLTYALQSGAFTDGEQRSVPVFPRGSLETVGQFFVLENDTSLRISTSAEYGAVTLHAQANVLEALLEETDKLITYPYGCMEQTASRLMALLLEKEIRAMQGQVFEHEAAIWEAVKRLETHQNPAGYWGWWGGGQASNWITQHVLRALQSAAQAGYPSNALELGLRLQRTQLEALRGPALLETLRLLSDLGQTADYERYLTGLDTLEWPLLHQFQIIRLKQAQGIPYALDSLRATSNKTLFGGLYWGSSRASYHLRLNNTQATLEAYRILRAEGDEASMRAIRQYFLMKRELNSGFGWLNTYETASVLATLLPDILAEQQGRPLTAPELQVQGRSIRSFPHTEFFPAGETLDLSKSGSGPMFVSTYQRFQNPEPGPMSTPFEVKTYWQQDGQEQTELRQGELAYLVVELRLESTAEYVMLEVPIPAACSYAENQRPSGQEVHREYWRQHTAIFCQQLPTGTYQFRIALEPRFTGKYTLNPARAEQMYFPTFYGRNALRVVEVR